MRAVDRAMADLGIVPLQTTEQAGRHLASLARTRFLHGDACDARVMILAGPGRNGAGALVCARTLHAWGARVRVVTAASPDALGPTARHHRDVLVRMSVPVQDWTEAEALRSPDLVVDGILGYGLEGAPREPASSLIRWTNGLSAPVLALDMPSGLDATTGEPSDPTTLAEATLTLGLPKHGLAGLAAAPFVGELFLADIGVPPDVYRSCGLDLDVGALFSRDEIVRLR